MLRTRLLTAVVLLSVLLPVLFLLPITYFGILVGVVLSVAAWEWCRLVYPNSSSKLPIYYAFAVTTHGLAWIYFFNLVWIDILITLVVIFWLVVIPLLMRQSTSLQLKRVNHLLAFFGFILMPVLWFSVMHIRMQGLGFLLSVLCIVWVADIGAYFVGKTLGRHKLAPQLSPGKTIEGALGGLFLVCLMGTLCIALDWFTLFTWAHELAGYLGALVLVAILVGLSIMGDLFESQLKRLAGVKDSSHLLPGHGGVLDRIDALMPVLPTTILILMILSH